MNNQSDIRASIEKAQKQAGNGSVNNDTISCSSINLGIFFDGTGNSRGAADKGLSSHTNIDLMEKQYKKATIVRNNCNVKCDSFYMTGIGVDEQGNEYPTVLGTGQTYLPGNSAIDKVGVYARVNDALDQGYSKLSQASQGQPQNEVLVDVFGFSRGAAAARHFCNQINNDGALDGPWGKPKIRFLGLYDCVASMGWAGDFDEGDLQIQTPNAAHIVHITAEDEIRTGFKLTLAKRGVRIEMPGVHSDIGGGYNPDGESGSYVLGNDYDEISRVYNFIQERYDEPIETIASNSAVPGYTYQYNWHAEGGLSNVAYNLMHRYAKMRGVPLEESNVPVPPDLQIYLETLSNREPLSEAQKVKIRKKYAHFSAENLVGFEAEPDAKRDVRTI